MKAIAFVSVIVLLTLVTACTKRVNWSEDVQLADGRVVTLKRHQVFGGPHESLQPPTESVDWLKFKHPDPRKTFAGTWHEICHLLPCTLTTTRHNCLSHQSTAKASDANARSLPICSINTKSAVGPKPVGNLRGRRIKRNMLRTLRSEGVDGKGQSAPQRRSNPTTCDGVYRCSSDSEGGTQSNHGTQSG
jgi:hypothetical protein